jgi:hypothetical protein
MPECFVSYEAPGLALPFGRLNVRIDREMFVKSWQIPVSYPKISTIQMEAIQLPEEKLNQLAQQISERLSQTHFFEQGTVRGDQLRQFSPNAQVNNFLLFQVFQAWELQLAKLSHPFFNLEHPEIAATIQTLKNQISQHIEIRREDFIPVLQRAVFNNLKLILDPAQFLSGFFFSQKEKLSLEAYRRFALFFSDMDFVVNSILKYYEKSGSDTVEKDVFLVKMSKVVDIYNQKSPRGFDDYRADLFRKLTGEDLDRLREELKRREQESEEALRRAEAARRQAEEEARRREEAARRQAEEEARRREEEARRQAEEEARRKSLFDSLQVSGDVFDLDEEGNAPAPLAPAPAPAPLPPSVSESKPIFVSQAPPAPAEGEFLEVAETLDPEKRDEPAPLPSREPTTSYLDRFLSHKKSENGAATAPASIPDRNPSILDRFQDKSRSAAEQTGGQKQIADQFAQSRKIKLDEIPIHKQYQFVQKVFEGNNVRFRIIVDKVNNARNKEEVEEILNKFVLNSETLVQDDPVTQEFVALLRNRF